MGYIGSRLLSVDGRACAALCDLLDARSALARLAPAEVRALVGYRHFPCSRCGPLGNLARVYLPGARAVHLDEPQRLQSLEGLAVSGGRSPARDQQCSA